ncbi:terminase small subunit [Gemmata sp. SH-PL17]|uniref:terminase small subunit n=1 Tax=Gemmata sp. SH-PL17 TaxID=1630693 RepID=UPI0012F7D7F4|nr:terminase small subunit [Gemmata sp. SH-PL17]
MSDPLPTKRQRRHKRKPPLSATEVRFCVLWVDKKNATQCYIDAGFPEKPNRVATAKAASELLKKPDISAFIRNLQTAAADAAKATIEVIAQGLARSANKDLRKLYDANGCIKPPHEWPDELAAVIEGVETEELYEWVERPHPDTGKMARARELIGYVRKVKTTNRTEAQKTLAAWRRMIGTDAAVQENKSAAPLVIERGPAHIPPPDDLEAPADAPA